MKEATLFLTVCSYSVFSPAVSSLGNTPGLLVEGLLVQMWLWSGRGPRPRNSCWAQVNSLSFGDLRARRVGERGRSAWSFLTIHYQAHGGLSVEVSLGQGCCPLIGPAWPVTLCGHGMRWPQWRSQSTHEREKNGPERGSGPEPLGEVCQRWQCKKKEPDGEVTRTTQGLRALCFASCVILGTCAT